jgi:signal transduction histidine kinase
MNTKLYRLARELTDAKKRLRRETARREAADSGLRKSQKHYDALLTESRLMQEQLKHFSHQILLVQEEERKHISRELHDDISQLLTGINVRLATLKIESTANTGNLKKKISNTQRLVEKSVDAVHRFARELRPAMLDDLGLVPALLAFMKEFGKRTGLQIRFTAMPADKIEQLSNLKRTMIYRVAQEALTNVTKHARASLAKVSIRIQSGGICMEISDNGKSFDVNRALGTRRRGALGILGMRERVELIGGTFAIESAQGKGTTVRVQIPLRNGVKADLGVCA